MKDCTLISTQDSKEEGMEVEGAETNTPKFVKFCILLLNFFFVDQSIKMSW